MTETFEIVVVSSDLESRRHLAGILTKLGLDPVCVPTLKDCHEHLSGRTAGLVFCDPHVTDGSYKDLLGAYRTKDSRPRVVVTSRFADWEQFKEAMRCGAFDVIASPCRPTDVEWMVIQAKRDERNRAGSPIPLPLEKSGMAAATA